MNWNSMKQARQAQEARMRVLMAQRGAPAGVQLEATNPMQGMSNMANTAVDMMHRRKQAQQANDPWNGMRRPRGLFGIGI